MEHAVVDGEFVTYSHIKTRKTFSIVIEFPEEQALHVLNTLGSPVGGNSKRVAVCLLNEQSATIRENRIVETTEGEKLRTRAVMLCKDELFWKFIDDCVGACQNESESIEWLYKLCNITSRAHLATDEHAQDSFNILIERFKEWQLQCQYADNLNRY